MNNGRKKKTKSEIAVLIAAFTMMLGLIVMLVGITVGGDEDEIGSLGVTLVGVVVFAGSFVTVCVATAYTRRGKKREAEKAKAALPENAVFLADGISAHFTSEGLCVVRDATFLGFEPAIPYSELIIYCRRIRKSSRAKGKETIFLVLPEEGDELFSEGWDEGKNMYAVGEEVLPLARKYGVKILDRRCPPVKKLTFEKKFTYRPPEQLKRAVRWTFISLAAFAAVLGVSILLAVYTEVSSGIAGGIAAGVVTPCVLNAVNNWRKNVLKVYAEGIFLSINGARHFLFWEEIERMEEEQAWIFFDCGDIGVSFPAVAGAAEYLREIHPEKFKESA